MNESKESTSDPRRAELRFDPAATVIIPRPTVERRPPVPDDVWHITVEVIGGPLDGSRERIPGPIFTIGRAIENDLALNMDPMVSARHARIVREGQHYWLEDLGSRNGTFIGDKRLAERTLIAPGATFTVGRTMLEFMPR